MVRQIICLLGALALLTALLARTLSWYAGQSTTAVEPIVVGTAQTLILDAGHGGEDGGAVSLTGVPESRLNLEIVRRMDDLLGLYGVPAVLLREGDVSLHDDTAVTLREKKASDLKNRTAMVEALENGVLISIHQNTYPDGQYRGAQAFYAPTEGSRELAARIQQVVRAALQPENTRQEKAIPDSVYLMNHITCPGVLVECGFLTNPEEEALLRDGDYQKKLAAALVSAWLTWQEAG